MPDSAGVGNGGLGAAGGGVDARDLPLAAGAVHRLAHARAAPVPEGGVGGVEHLEVVISRALRAVEERPDVVEEVDAEFAVGFGVEEGVRVGGWHGR